MKIYLINEEELDNLIMDSLTLQALDAGGVNSWSWYGDSVKDFLQEAGVKEFEELILKTKEEMGVTSYNVSVD